MAPKMKLIDQLRKMEIFEELSQQDLEQVAKLVRERRITENAVLFKQGDPGDAMFIVQEGRIKLVTSDSLGREKVLAFRGEGEFFGEMALLTGAPRTATAIAAADSRLVVLGKEDFDKLVATSAVVMKEMLKVAALRQAATGQRITSDDGTARGKVYAIFGPRGGGGKTTLAVNLAVAFAADNPDAVGLLDLDVTFGNTALALNMTPKSSLAAVSSEAMRNLDRESINYYLTTHESSLRVFAGSSRPEEGETVSGEHVRSALNQLRRVFAHLVVDTAANFNETTLAALEDAEKIVVVVNPEPTCVRDARECIRIFTELLHMPPEKFYFVLNHTLPYKGLKKEEIQQALGVQISVEIPYAGDMPAQAALRGEPFVLKQAGSGIAKAIEHIRRDLERQAAEIGAAALG